MTTQAEFNPPFRIRVCRWLLLASACVASGPYVPLRADTVLETETAELGKKGEITISNSVQFERERDGSRAAFTLTQFEYAISDRAELLIEPFFQEWVRPKGAKSFHGLGDLEITPSYLLVLDDMKTWTPAVVLAYKIKVPTAHNLDIGTRRTDHYPYLILGKEVGQWIFNANFGYDIIGRGSDDHNTRSQWIYDFSIERMISVRWSVFGEIFGNSSPSVGERRTFSEAIATEY